MRFDHDHLPDVQQRELECVQQMLIAELEQDEILNKLQKLDTEEQRAIRAFVSDYAARPCNEPREAMAARLLKRLGIDFRHAGDGARAKLKADQCPG